MKTGIVDVGGGMRGVYAAGVFDRCLDIEIHFDVCVGVSAGSANISSYIAGQKGRNYPFFTQYPLYYRVVVINDPLQGHVLHWKGCCGLVAGLLPQDGSRKAPTTAPCSFVDQLDTARRLM